MSRKDSEWGKVKKEWAQQHQEDLERISGKRPITEAEYIALKKELEQFGFYQWLRELEDRYNVN